MKFLRNLIDFLVAIILIVILLWSAFLFWGAYSQHRVAILVDQNIFMDIRDDIKNQLKDPTQNCKIITNDEIAKLEKAQKELFDTNTSSFIFQFITLLLITLGAAILGLIYQRFKLLKEELDLKEDGFSKTLVEMKKEVEESQKQRKKVESAFTKINIDRNYSYIIGLEYCFLNSTVNILQAYEKSNREGLMILISDYQGEIERNIKLAIQKDEGIEPALFEIALDMAEQTDRMIKTILETSGDEEEIILKNVLSRNSKCRRILIENGKNLTSRFENQLREIFEIE